MLLAVAKQNNQISSTSERRRLSADEEEMLFFLYVSIRSLHPERVIVGVTSTTTCFING
jgi:hypothetical protein